MATLTDFQKVDLIDDHLAADYNRLMANALRPEFANTQTLSATKELVDNDCQFQFLTASGADRTVELAPEATTNHMTVVYNSGASNNLVVKDDAGAITFATLAPDEWALFLPLNAEGWRVWRAPINTAYRLSVTVSANDLIVALQHHDGSTPTAHHPLALTIAGTRRYITASLSITIADGTNWFNAGSAELATQLVPYFVYVVWDTNSSAVGLAIARLPYGKVVSDFSTTTTSERHLFGFSGFTSTDTVENIGYFEATLSAGAAYTWTVPSFTNASLRFEPTYQSRDMVWVPQWTSSGTAPAIGDGTLVARYQVDGSKVFVNAIQTNGATTTYGTGTYSWSLPFTSKTVSGLSWQGVAQVYDSSTTTSYIGRTGIGSNAATVNVWTHGAAGLMSGTVPVTMAQSDAIALQGYYFF